MRDDGNRNLPGLSSALGESLARERSRVAAAEELARLRRIEAEYTRMRDETNSAQAHRAAPTEDSPPPWFMEYMKKQEEATKAHQAKEEERLRWLQQETLRREVRDHVAKADGVDLIRTLGAEEYVLSVLQSGEMTVEEAVKTTEEALRAQGRKIVADEKIRAMLTPTGDAGGTAGSNGAPPDPNTPPTPPSGGSQTEAGSGERGAPPDNSRPSSYQDRLQTAQKMLKFIPIEGAQE